MTGVGLTWCVLLSRFLFLIPSREIRSLVHFVPSLAVTAVLPGITCRGSKDVVSPWMAVEMQELVGVGDVLHPRVSVEGGSSREDDSSSWVLFFQHF